MDGSISNSRTGRGIRCERGRAITWETEILRIAAGRPRERGCSSWIDLTNLWRCPGYNKYFHGHRLVPAMAEFARRGDLDGDRACAGTVDRIPSREQDFSRERGCGCGGDAAA